MATFLRVPWTATVREMLFSEPSGRGIGLFFLGCSLAELLAWAYFAVVLDASPGPTLLILGGGFALSGVAESLPTDRRRLAGVLRVVAVSGLLGFLGLLFVVPGIVTG